MPLPKAFSFNIKLLTYSVTTNHNKPNLFTKILRIALWHLIWDLYNLEGKEIFSIISLESH